MTTLADYVFNSYSIQSPLAGPGLHGNSGYHCINCQPCKPMLHSFSTKEQKREPLLHYPEPPVPL